MRLWGDEDLLELKNVPEPTPLTIWKIVVLVGVGMVFGWAVAYLLGP